MAAEVMTREFSHLVAQHFGGSPESVPRPNAVAAKRWGAGFTAGSLGLAEDTIGLEPWRLAIAGDFLRSHHCPAEAAAQSGLAAGERVASWFADIANSDVPS